MIKDNDNYLWARKIGGDLINSTPNSGQYRLAYDGQAPYLSLDILGDALRAVTNAEWGVSAHASFSDGKTKTIVIVQGPSPTPALPKQQLLAAIDRVHTPGEQHAAAR